MGRVLILFFLFIMLEIYTFVVVGDAIGYLFAIFLIFVISYAGTALTRRIIAGNVATFQRAMEIMRNDANVDTSKAEYANLKNKLFAMDANEQNQFLANLSRRCMVDQLIIVLFIVPGFITDGIALILLLLSARQSFLLGGLLSSSMFEKFSSSKFGTFQQHNYGKSARDLEKEAQEFARAQQGDIPRENPNAGSATVEEMKAKFQAEKEVVDATYEVVADDDDDKSKDESKEDHKDK